MKITTANTYASVIRYAHVDDGPVLKAPTSSTGKMMRVESVKVTYQPDDTGRWIVRWASSVELAGPFLKKDGTDSATRTDTHLRDLKDGGDHAPWLVAIVDALRPVGFPQMTTTNALEIEDPR